MARKKITRLCVASFLINVVLVIFCWRQTRWQQTQYPVSRDAKRSLSPMTSIWHPVVESSKRISYSCSKFIMYSVSVHGSYSEAHHTSGLGGAPLKKVEGFKHCSVLFLLVTQSNSNVSNDKLQTYSDLGWQVLFVYHEIPAIFTRRASRAPKILPHLFFPHTDVVLYADVKLLVDLQSLDAMAVASKLLSGTQFGVVQHGWARGMEDEQNLILDAKRSRPYVVDSVETLRLQASVLHTFLSSFQKHSFAVDASLHARVLRGPANSNTFSDAWYDEYSSGCDRDQMAFYGAAARMDMQKQKEFHCNNFNRSGIYTSHSKVTFSFAIHCDFKRFGISGYP